MESSLAEISSHGSNSYQFLLFQIRDINFQQLSQFKIHITQIRNRFYLTIKQKYILVRIDISDQPYHTYICYQIAINLIQLAGLTLYIEKFWPSLVKAMLFQLSSMTHQQIIWLNNMAFLISNHSHIQRTIDKNKQMRVVSVIMKTF